MNTKSAFRIVFLAVVSIAIAFSGQIYPVQAEINSYPPQGWVETRFIVGTSDSWDPAQGEVAFCWGGVGSDRFLNVYGPEDFGENLYGDSCRMFVYDTEYLYPQDIEELALWWQYSLTLDYGPEWPISYVDGNNPPIPFPEGWVETQFIIGPSDSWDPVQGEVALCWGEPRFLDVFGPEDGGETLYGDACRMFVFPVPSSEDIEHLAAWWQYSLTLDYGPEWPISYVNGNEPPYFENFLPLIMG
jgi:hypothetical protein